MDVTLIERLARLRGVGDAYHDYRGELQYFTLETKIAILRAMDSPVDDAAALAEAIRSKRLAGAALDVYAPEPPPADFPLLGLPNVLLAPHMAARTGTALENMSWVVRDVVAVLDGEKPRYPAP